MTKRILTLALATAATCSAFAIGPKRVLPQGDQFNTPIEVKGVPQITTRAAGDNSLDFTLADAPFTATGLNGMSAGMGMYLAFEFSEDNTNVFAGDSITSINIYTGCVPKNNQAGPNQVRNITLFIKDDLSGNTLYTQDGTLGSEPLTLNKIPLDKAFKIEAGKSFYVGYNFKLPVANQYPMTIDGIPTDNMEGCWVGVEQNGKVQWMNFADQVGNLCMGCTIVGEKMPQNRVEINEYSGPSYVQPGKPFEYVVLVKNLGQAPVKQIEVAYSVGTGEKKTAAFNVSNFIYNAYGQFALDDLVCNDLGPNIPLKIEITKTDGVDNTCSTKAVEIPITCFSAADGFTRVNLVEEATGTWCGWCPGGIVLLDYMRETYPEQFALAAIHASNGASIDRMQVASTSSWRNVYAQGFPSGYINRALSFIVSNNEAPCKEVIDNYVKESAKIPAMLGFGDLTYTIDEQNTMTVTTAVKSAVDFTNNDRYRLSFYVVQDGVGPYNQNNSYAASGFTMGGWEKKPRTVSTVYDDVVRYMAGGVTGFTNSLPNDIKKGEDVTY
ncbi:MAG: hypothetical protein K2H18_07945, partial [Muribaculaceae bacterium]|nr:hypothetical protein [Muribaculaceae bacterium]